MRVYGYTGTLVRYEQTVETGRVATALLPRTPRGGPRIRLHRHAHTTRRSGHIYTAREARGDLRNGRGGDTVGRQTISGAVVVE